MTRALSTCAEPRCPRPAVKKGRCLEHQLPDQWRAGKSGYDRNGWEWQRTVARILARDRGVCYRCGGQAVTADHLIPRSQGGSDQDSNLAAVCASCNRDKALREAQAARWG